MTNQKGFTLIELLLYMAVSGIVLFALSVFLSTILQTRVKNETIAEVDRQGAAVLAAMTQTIRNAQEISSPVAGNSAASLTLVIDDVALTPTVYSVSAGAFMVTEGASSPVPLTNSRVLVSDLEFENLSSAGSPGSVRITFTLARVNTSGRNEYEYSREFQGTASLRQP